MRSPYRRPGTSFQPGLSSNVHPSPLILVPLVLAGARTTTALQSGFIRAPLLASKTPQLSVMRMPDRRYRRFPTAGGFAGRTVVHVSEGEGEHRPVDEFAAIEAIVTWEEFATSIAEAQKLALYSSAASEKSETAASSSSVPRKRPHSRHSRHRALEHGIHREGGPTLSSERAGPRP